MNDLRRKIIKLIIFRNLLLINPLLNSRKSFNCFPKQCFRPALESVIMPKRKINQNGEFAVVASLVEAEPVKAKRGRSKKELDAKLVETEEIPQVEPAKAPKRKLKAKGEEVGSPENVVAEEAASNEKSKVKNKGGAAKAGAKKAEENREVEKPTRGRKKAETEVPIQEKKVEKVLAKKVEENQEVEKPTRGRKKAEPAEVPVQEEKVEKATSKKGRKAAESAKPDVTEVKPKRGKKAAVKPEEDKADIPEPKETKPKKAPKAKAAAKEPKPATDITAPANQTDTKWEDLDFTCSKQNAKGQLPNLKITSWNVDGLRAWIKKGGLSIFKYGVPDILCLQETKCSDDKMPDEAKEIEGYYRYSCASDKDGYAGVAVYSKVEPIDVQYGIGEDEHDAEGRCITAEYDKFFLVCVYVPNAGRGLVTLPKRLKWNESFKEFIKSLDNQKPVIIAGDMNVAHTEIDLTNPSTNTKNAGFTKEEREGMTDFLQDGYVDTFRQLYPGKTGVYTFWSYMNKARSKNIGWRLDYFTISERIKDNVCDSVVHSNVFGSDHCPLTLFINI